MSDELCRLLKKKKNGQILSLDNSRIAKACTGPYSFLKNANS